MTTSNNGFAISKDVTTIIWDLDGTLIDSVGVFEDVLKLISPRHGFAMPSHQAVLANFHGSLQDSISNVLGIHDDRLDAIVDDFLISQDDFYDAIEHHIFSDALDLAQRSHAAGIRQVLVTNRAHAGRLRASPRSIVENSELGKYIDRVICGDDSEHRKPKPQVLAEVHIDPAETVVVGDQFVDAEFAHNLGAAGVIVHRHHDEPMHFDTLPPEVRTNATVVSSLEQVSVDA